MQSLLANKSIISKFKIYILFFSIIFSMLSFTAINSITSFGKRFNQNKDFTCCKKGQLIQHHFYNYYIFGIKTISGYVEEAVGKPNVESCNIECSED
jgi:hypothetical protein